MAWRLFQLTGIGDYVTLAGLFDHPTFLGRMSAGGDGLEREHANFHEPIAMGAYSRYEITGDEESRRAFRNFIELLRDTRSYATAGVRRRAVAGARPARANHRVHGDAGDVHAGEL